MEDLQRDLKSGDGVSKFSIEGIMIRAIVQTFHPAVQLLAQLLLLKAADLNVPGLPIIDEIIEPKDTRKKIISALSILENKAETPRQFRKHGNIPL